MARKNRTPEESARREKIRELLQMANIDSMDDIQNLFKETLIAAPLCRIQSPFGLNVFFVVVLAMFSNGLNSINLSLAVSA